LFRDNLVCIYIVPVKRNNKTCMLGKRFHYYCYN
jgi:hypothetical protein